MPRPIDQMQLGPTREITHLPDGGVQVKITPPKWANVGEGTTITLTAAQYEGYQRWRDGALIQDALPDLSADEREALLTGITDFDERFPEEDDEEDDE